MHENEPNDREHKDDQTSPERKPEGRPRIYVASLSDYNEGRLCGTWIDAAQPEKELWRCIKQMLDRCPSHGAEEWMIHDYEGFGQLHLNEFESLEAVAEVAAGIVAHGPAFAAWAAHVGADSGLLDQFEDAYMGEWQSGKEFAEQMLDDMGELEKIKSKLSDHLAPYVEIDYDSYFDDLVFGGQISTMEKLDGGIYVFRNW
jgi:antirestriction protein